MSRPSRRARRRKKQIIKRRRIILLIFVLLLIPLLYKGGKYILNRGKSLYSSVKVEGDNKEEISEKDMPVKEEPIEPETAEARILSVGDLMFHMPQVKSAYLGDGNYDFTGNFEHVKKYISEADIAIGNFETVTAGNDKKFSGFPQFNSPKETLLALKETGFDIVSTANNHSLDQGKEGILNTLKYSKEYGLKAIGTYESPQKEFVIEEKNGIKIGFIAYTYGLNSLEFYLSDEELSYMVNRIDEDKIKMDIDKLKDQVDIIAVSLHWGTEYQREPSQDQIDLGHKMVDWGANIIFGSHPHVLQKSEIIKKDGRDNFIIYSQGNFFSNQSKESMGNSFTEDGVMVAIDLEKDITNEITTIKNVEFLPTWIYKYKEKGKDIYKILPTTDVLDGNLKIELTDNIKQRINQSHEDSMTILEN